MPFKDGQIEFHLPLGPRVADRQLAGNPRQPLADELARVIRQIIGKRHRVRRQCSAQFFLRLPVLLDQTRAEEPFEDCTAFVDLEGARFAIGQRIGQASEQVDGDEAELDLQLLLHLPLQPVRVIGVALLRDNGEHVQPLVAAALAFVIDAKAQTATDGLAAARLAGHFAQAADLEDIGIVPPFTQRRVREQEA